MKTIPKSFHLQLETLVESWVQRRLLHVRGLFRAVKNPVWKELDLHKGIGVAWKGKQFFVKRCVLTKRTRTFRGFKMPCCMSGVSRIVKGIASYNWADMILDT